jgi:hypothetical protein
MLSSRFGPAPAPAAVRIILKGRVKLTSPVDAVSPRRGSESEANEQAGSEADPASGFAFSSAVTRRLWLRSDTRGGEKVNLTRPDLGSSGPSQRNQTAGVAETAEIIAKKAV